MVSFCAGLVIILAVATALYPGALIYFLMFVDFYTPWVLFDSPLYDKYHNYLLSNKEESEELPIPELHADNYTVEDIHRLSKDFTFPIVIRGMVENATALDQWMDSEWWVGNYADERVLCGTLDKVREFCTIKDFFDEIENGNPFYISGSSNIFIRNPELQKMIDNPRIVDFEPGPRRLTQVFMGLGGMGSDIHSAMGVNIFRQVAGKKKWWFIPPSQTPYLKPSMNVNGFSAHTHTLVGIDGQTPSPWLKKIERYTSVLEPGDVLINPPWFWHGILNTGDPSELVIGVPTRYVEKPAMLAAIRSNPIMTLLAVSYMLPASLFMEDVGPQNAEGFIEKNRLSRMK